MHLKTDNKMVIDVVQDDEEVVVISKEKCRMLKISNGEQIITSIRLNQQHQPTCYASYLKGIASKFEMPAWSYLSKSPSPILPQISVKSAMPQIVIPQPAGGNNFAMPLNSAAAVNRANSAQPVNGDNSAVPGNRDKAAMPGNGDITAVPVNRDNPVMPGNGDITAVPVNGDNPVMPGNGESSAVPVNGDTSLMPGNGYNSAVPRNGDKSAIPGSKDNSIAIRENLAASASRHHPAASGSGDNTVPASANVASARGNVETISTSFTPIDVINVSRLYGQFENPKETAASATNSICFSSLDFPTQLGTSDAEKIDSSNCRSKFAMEDCSARNAVVQTLIGTPGERLVDNIPNQLDVFSGKAPQVLRLGTINESFFSPLDIPSQLNELEVNSATKKTITNGPVIAAVVDEVSVIDVPQSASFHDGQLVSQNTFFDTIVTCPKVATSTQHPGLNKSSSSTTVNIQSNTCMGLPRNNAGGGKHTSASKPHSKPIANLDPLTSLATMFPEFSANSVQVPIDRGYSIEENALINAREIMEPLLRRLKARQTYTGEVPQSWQHFKILTIEGLPIPFIVFPLIRMEHVAIKP